MYVNYIGYEGDIKLWYLLIYMMVYNSHSIFIAGGNFFTFSKLIILLHCIEFVPTYMCYIEVLAVLNVGVTHCTFEQYDIIYTQFYAIYI